jgi:GT2 family glycosyltransferase
MPQVCFIINSFNRAALLAQSLSSIEAIRQDPRIRLSVVIFEAGSTDGSVDTARAFQARSRDVQVTILQSQPGEDSSFAAGLNRACAERLAAGPVDYFLAFETDNFINGIDPLLRAVALFEIESKVAAIGFTVKRRDGSPTGFGESFPTVLSFILGQRLSSLLHLDRPRINWLHGGASIGRYSYADIVYTSPLLIRASVWSVLDGMDAKMFPFADSDLDLAFRMRSKGFRMAVLEENGVFHDNLGQLSEWSSSRTLRFHQARYALLERHRTRFMSLLRPVLCVRHLLELVALLMRSVSRRTGKASVRVRLLQLVWSGYR